MQAVLRVPQSNRYVTDAEQPQTLWRWLQAHVPHGFVLWGVGSDDGELGEHEIADRWSVSEGRPCRCRATEDMRGGRKLDRVEHLVAQGDRGLPRRCRRGRRSGRVGCLRGTIVVVRGDHDGERDQSDCHDRDGGDACQASAAPSTGNNGRDVTRCSRSESTENMMPDVGPFRLRRHGGANVRKDRVGASGQVFLSGSLGATR
jgi:hypothetical protein